MMTGQTPHRPVNESAPAIIYRGWTLTQDALTKLWTARRGQDALPACSRTGTLRTIIDSLTGPEIRECCTGDACHV